MEKAAFAETCPHVDISKWQLGLFHLGDQLALCKEMKHIQRQSFNFDETEEEHLKK